MLISSHSAADLRPIAMQINWYKTFRKQFIFFFYYDHLTLKEKHLILSNQKPKLVEVSIITEDLIISLIPSQAR